LKSQKAREETGRYGVAWDLLLLCSSLLLLGCCGRWLGDLCCIKFDVWIAVGRWGWSGSLGGGAGAGRWRFGGCCPAGALGHKIAPSTGVCASVRAG
jgi:hypothetical protein